MPGKTRYLLPVAFAVLAGCGGDSNTGGTAIDQSATGSELEFQLPVVIRESSVVDITQVSGFVNVNGRNFEMQRTGDRYSIDIPNIPVNSDVDIDLRFIERLTNGAELILAETEPMTFSVGQSDQTIEFFENQFNFPDEDQDGFTNIEERNNETDPFTPENTGSRNIIVQFNIPQIIQDPGITQIIALFADSPRAVEPNGTVLEATGRVANGIAIEVDIRLQQQFAGEEVPVANATDTIAAGVDDVILVLPDDRFDFGIDSDNDGIINLVELQTGTDPFVVN